MKPATMEPHHYTAVITGATSGIGKTFATEFAKKGYDLIITGRRKEILLKVANTLSQDYNIKAEIFAGDLSDPQNRLALCQLLQQAGDIVVLINNAGFGNDRPLYGNSPDDIREMINTHILATAELTKSVLQGMIYRKQGIIINVSSLAAFTPGLTKSMYLSTKSFVHYFSESLSMEVKSFGIKVQSLCPGLTRSDFHRDLQKEELEKKFRFLRFMTPEKVVSHSLKALEKGYVLCIPGKVNKLLFIFAKCLPSRVLMWISLYLNNEHEVSSQRDPIPGYFYYSETA